MKNEVTFVSGQRGSGKSYWVKHEIESLSRYMVFDTMNEYEGRKIEDLEELADHCQSAGDGFLEAVYDPSDPQAELPWFCRIAYAVGNVCVIIEEVDVFADPYNMPEYLGQVVKRGRHRGVNLMAVSQRPAAVNRLLTSQASRFVIFRHFEPRDIAYFRSIIGPYAEKLPTLGLYEFYVIDFSQGPLLAMPTPQRL